jgi:taurine--2-oxoglutarate transaminase
MLPQDTRSTYELDRAHVFHSWSAQATLDPKVINRAEGSYLWDESGKRYLDFTSQLVNTNIGHQHPKVVAAIREQAGKLCTINPAHATESRSEAARLVSELTPAGMDKVFFTNAGAEAVENAIRMARLHTGRFKTLSNYRSYHGNTSTAIGLTGDPRRWRNDYGNTGAVHFFGPYAYRSAFHAADEQEECQRALEHLDQVITLEGPDTIAAIILETVPGGSGILPPPPGYLQGVRELCDKHGIVYIADEVMAGFGRTGRWFAFEHYDVTPDLITFAKGINSGYVPLGGVVLGDHIAADFDHQAYPGGLTYSGHPLACAAAVATMNAMAEEKIVDNAATIGETVIGPGLRELAERHPSVGEVRGLGVFWALELVKDRTTREPVAPYAGSSEATGRFTAKAVENGLLVPAPNNRVHVVPPCTISDEEAREGIAIIDRALDEVDAYVTES